MKQILVSLGIIILLTSSAHAQLPFGYPDTNRTKENINLGWAFSKMPKTEKPTAIDFDDSKWEQISIPHNPDPVSLSIDDVIHNWKQEKYLRDHNWYRKQMHIDLDENEKAFIEFEGVHNATELWVNGKFVGRYAINGFIPHHFDITDYIRPGEINTIAINADNSFDATIAPDPDETDYVKWAGIYRDVYLVKKNKLHVNFNWESADAGVHITTPAVKERNGTVSVKTTVVNKYSTAANCRIETMLIDAEGFVLKKLNDEFTIAAGHQKSFRQTTEIEDNYNLWSPDNPYLYRAVSVIYMDGKAVDFVENKFGFRSLELVKGQGLLLNGAPFFMVGVNRHQSYPHIGDAVPNSIHYEAALRYKEAGINTIRLSHYPQDNAFIEACDELGILLYEEASSWIQWKQGEWMSNLEQSLRVMVRNHRNHPSIAIWGAGINHRGPVAQLNNAAKEEDPFRFTASASSPWCGTKNAGVTDIYATMDYRRTDWPENDFCLVMEHGYSHDALVNQTHISRYKRRKNNIGALLWVGADYNRLRPNVKLTDMVTEYGLQTAYRIPRPSYYWYISEYSKAPYVHIADESVYKNQTIHVYSNALEVALYANDKLIAIQRADTDPLRNLNAHPSFTFRYNWTNEKLTAKALNYGNTQATHSRTKAGEAYAIKLAFDRPNTALVSGGSDMKMLRAYIVDKNGEVIRDATNTVHFDSKGAGQILYANQAYINNAQPHHGVATVYLQGTANAGRITVKATSSKLKTATITIESAPFNANALAATQQSIYDYPNYKIDIQSAGQLPQFGWKVAEGTSTEKFEFKLDKSTCTITSDNGLTWTKGTYTMLGDLGYMGCDGVYAKKGKLHITFTDLPKGKYYLKSYHHAFVKTPKLFPYAMKVDQKDNTGEFKYVKSNEAIGMYDFKDLGERKPVSITSIIESNGTDPVTISVETDKPDAPTWINGFEFKQIK